MKTFSIENRQLPALLLGSSPFCGAGQFREKAEGYFNRFYRQPENITKLLVKFCEMGYRGAHILSSPPIAGATLQAYKKLNYTFPVVITLMPGEMEEQQWEWVTKLDTVAVFIHAFETDRLIFEDLKAFSEKCRKRGVIPCAATHNGGKTIPAIDGAGIDIAAYICPFNKTGMHVHPSLNSTLKAIQTTQKKIIGMKVLSCGELSPEEAFEFSLPYVDAIAVGMVANEEIEENCKAFEKYEHLLATKRKQFVQ